MVELPLIALLIVIIIWLIGAQRAQRRIKDLTNKLTNAEKKNKELESHTTLLSEKNEVSEKKNKDLQSSLFDLTNKYVRLIKYEGLISIEDKANEIISQANTELLKANEDAKSIRYLAKDDAEKLKKQSEILLATSKVDASKIIEDANRKAEEIAGEAIKALNNQREIEKTVKAMKNIIEGYGDQYLAPTYSLLDDLADEFGHTEAGIKLKDARNNTNILIRDNKAAKCDYVEEYRRTTAINFVLDAFNGKVDSILSKVKKDNYGILEQKIRDAFQLVNNNGKAFRDAVITQEYLNARLEELKWAVVAQELKWKEQEEQRIIREQIREEEKAKREYERAIREAQKEEETLKRLIEKAQKEVNQATEEQKAKFEERLQELEGKLKEAEEKNQRALSMAQQTKSGNVYIISNIGSFGENVYKIGMTRRLDPLDRIKELGDASVPFEFDVHSMIYSEDAPGLERELHKKFLRLQMNKVNPRKEFFKITLTEIKAEIDKMNIDAKWTLTAEARQYRESLAIEQAIANNTQKQAEWEKYQLQLDPISLEQEEADI